MKSFRLKQILPSALFAMLCLMFSCISYAQTTSTTTGIGYFYSASGEMMDAESNTGSMSSYLTRSMRYNGTDETFAISNIKDVTAEVNSSGSVLNKYTYTPYGTPTSYNSNTQINASTNPKLSLAANPYTYSGYYTDSESGNYYLNARYYDPTLGVFLTSDTYNLLNNYMYVKGNPVMGVDPTGHVVKWYHFHTHLANFFKDLFGECGCMRRAKPLKNDIDKNNSHAFNKEEPNGNEMGRFNQHVIATKITDIVIDLDQNVLDSSSADQNNEVGKTYFTRHQKAFTKKRNSPFIKIEKNQERLDALKSLADNGVNMHVATDGPYTENDIKDFFQKNGININKIYTQYTDESQKNKYEDKVVWMTANFEKTNNVLLMDNSNLNISNAKEAKFQVFKTDDFVFNFGDGNE